MAERDPRLLLHEVVVIGQRRKPDDKSEIDATLQGDALANAIKEKFVFMRDTNLRPEAVQAGIQQGTFFQCRFAAPGGLTETLGNGKTYRVNSKTTVPGRDNLFKRTRGVLFDEIKAEIIAGRFEPVAGDRNSGEVKLTLFAVVGFWDKFPLGFTYKIHTVDKAGKLVPFLTKRRQDDGTYKEEQGVTNMYPHFVYEDEIANLETLRNNIRSRLERFKLTVESDNVDDRGTNPAGNVDGKPDIDDVVV